MPQGTTREIQDRVQTERKEGLGSYAFIRVHQYSALGFQGEVQTGKFKPREQGFIKPHRDLI